MKKYVFLRENGTCDVGIGSDEEFYRQAGFELRDVEQGYDGNWYLAGSAPEKPEEIIKNEQLVQLQQYLNETDWYVVRYSEDGIEIPAGISARRREARKTISRLRGKEE